MRSEITADHNLREKDLSHREETTDDYSFDRVPREERKMGCLSITNITFRIATAIFYFQIGIMTKGRYYMKIEAHDIPEEDWIA